MALKCDEETIGEITVRSIQLMPIASAKLQAKLIRIFAPSLANLKGMNAKELEKMLAMDLAALAPILGTLFGQLDDAMIDTLIRESFATTSAIVTGEDGKKKKTSLAKLDDVNTVFEGNTGAMYQAILFSWKVNFGDFSGGVFAKLRASTSEPEKTPTPANE